MTGYGQSVLEKDGRKITVEVRCVNHRFLDLGLRLPRALNAMEASVRKAADARLIRGHADITVTYANTRTDAVTVRTDDALAAAYHTALTRLKGALALTDDSVTTAYIASLPGVLTEEAAAEDQEAVESLLAEAIDAAFAQVSEARAREGERLKADLLLHLDNLDRLQQRLKALAADLPQNYQARLTERLAHLNAPVEPQRLAQEVALFADRCAIDEELSRLASHITEMRRLCEGEGPLGKQIDFLLQEMNREANTTASKSVSLEVTQAAVQCKNEIEKLREQAQNIL